MLSKQLLLGAVGLVTGAATSAGTFAFMIIVGVLPRIIGRWHQAKHAILFENMVVAGGIVGTILSVFEELSIPLGTPLLMLYGLCAGIFVGCISVALAEILNTFPIIFRRFRMKRGLAWVLFALAIGKMCGSFYFFFGNMSI